MPGRCGYGPVGRGGIPGCCVRTGCDGSGRGPPIGGRDPGYAGRGPAGPPGRIGCAGGRPVAVPVCPAAPPAAGRAVVGIAGRSTFGATRGASRGCARGPGDVGSGGAGVVGRCSSMRRRSVGGTTRPGVGGFGAGVGTSTGGAAASGAFAGGASCAVGSAV